MYCLTNIVTFVLSNRYKRISIRHLINISLSLLLLVATTGFSISAHYCGDSLVSVELNKEAEPYCDNPKCCQTETVFSQLDDDFVFAASNINLENTHIFDIPQYPVTLISKSYITETAININRPLKFPPPKTQSTLTGLQSFLL
ncbi:MAG: hypothetical protein WD577_04655 [Bacteroidales bacterium]